MSVVHASPPSATGLTWKCGLGGASNCTAGRTRSLSQQGEERSLIHSVFCDVCTDRRTYLEIGALDGLKYSNTYVLEHEYNWRGLLIEGLPQNAQGLIANRGRSGRNVIFNEVLVLIRPALRKPPVCVPACRS
jgi:hypothetical protein